MAWPSGSAGSSVVTAVAVSFAAFPGATLRGAFAPPAAAAAPPGLPAPTCVSVSPEPTGRCVFAFSRKTSAAFVAAFILIASCINAAQAQEQWLPDIEGSNQTAAVWNRVGNHFRHRLIYTMHISARRDGREPDRRTDLTLQYSVVNCAGNDFVTVAISRSPKGNEAHKGMQLVNWKWDEYRHGTVGYEIRRLACSNPDHAHGSWKGSWPGWQVWNESAHTGSQSNFILTSLRNRHSGVVSTIVARCVKNHILYRVVAEGRDSQAVNGPWDYIPAIEQVLEESHCMGKYGSPQ